jgi:HlyD family secretion protein
VRRVRELHERRVASKEQLDEAEERLEVANADLERAFAARIEGELRLAVAQRSLELAQARLAQTEARSPFQGIVLRREREVGDVAVPGAAVLRVAATDEIWASVWVDETFLDALRPDLPARVVLRSAPAQPLLGRVVRIGRELDRETRELLVDVALERLPERYAFGQRVDLWIETRRAADVLRIPAAFLVRRDGRAGAMAIEAGRAVFRPLQLGLEGRDWVEVRRGLAAGETLVRPALPGARPLVGGERVRPAEGQPQ